jgi:hypothetical protein
MLLITWPTLLSQTQTYDSVNQLFLKENKAGGNIRFFYDLNKMAKYHV